MLRYGGYAVPIAIHRGILRTLLQVGGDRGGEVVGRRDGSGERGLESNVLTRAVTVAMRVWLLCVLHV